MVLHIPWVLANRRQGPSAVYHMGWFHCSTCSPPSSSQTLANSLSKETRILYPYAPTNLRFSFPFPSSLQASGMDPTGCPVPGLLIQQAGTRGGQQTLRRVAWEFLGFRCLELPFYFSTQHPHCFSPECQNASGTRHNPPTFNRLTWCNVTGKCINTE